MYRVKRTSSKRPSSFILKIVQFCLKDRPLLTQGQPSLANRPLWFMTVSFTPSDGPLWPKTVHFWLASLDLVFQIIISKNHGIVIWTYPWPDKHLVKYISGQIIFRIIRINVYRNSNFWFFHFSEFEPNNFKQFKISNGLGKW